MAVSSFEYGLFLVDVDVAAAREQLRTAPARGEQHRFRQTLYGTDFSTCPHVVERRTCMP